MIFKTFIAPNTLVTAIVLNDIQVHQPTLSYFTVLNLLAGVWDIMVH